MQRTIGNPGSWIAMALGRAGHHMSELTVEMQRDEAVDPPIVQSLTTSDIGDALRAGWQDFMAVRSDVVFLCLLYPFIGLTMIMFAFNTEFTPYMFPLISGFALMGPVAAVFLYEISRRREAGEPHGWSHAVDLIRSPVMGPVVALGAYLFAIFIAWIVVAHFIYTITMGGTPIESSMGFFNDVLTTGSGWAMIAIGIPVGAVFAAVVLAMTIVSFPLLIDRRVGLPQAVATSLEVAKANPRVVASWGFVVAVLLAVASIPFFLGLVIVMPVLGHATWHLYRRAIG